MLKENGFKRKAALTLAVLSAIAPTSGISPMVNSLRLGCVAEAAEVHPTISLTDIIPAHETYTPAYVGWNASANRYGVYVYQKSPNSWTPAQWIDVYNLGEYFINVTPAGDGLTSSSHENPSSARVHAGIVIAKTLNSGLQSGLFMNEDKIKDILKDAGIDASETKITITKPIDAKDINVDGKITTTGDAEIGGDVIVHGSETIDHDLTVKGNETVDGDSRIHGDQTVDGGQTIYGDSNVKGDMQVQEDLRVDGNTQLGNDKGKDTLNVWAKTNLHGDTTIGDDEKDKFIVNATSEFKGDATFDKNVAIKGNLEIDGDSTTHGNSTVDGDSIIHGNETIDKNLHVKGDSEVDGNSSIQGDLDVKGNTTLGDDKNSDTLDVNAKTHLHGDTTIGDDTNDKLTINATTEFGGESTFSKDVHIKGDLETDGNSTTHGNTTTDGSALIYGNAGVAQNFYVGGDAKVKGDAVVDGDIYGRSFNVGDEKYIDKDGINANNHPIRNVADGEIGPNSLDAVNGRQLWHTREALQHNINQVGAGAAAMASLHPLDYEHDDKLSVSAAMGNYKDKTAMAAGIFYRPNIKSMFNLSGTLGYGDNMFGIGVTTKMGKVTEADTMTDEQLRDKVSEIHDENKELREENGKLKTEVSDLKEEIIKSNEQNTTQENKIAALTAKNIDLEKSLSDMTLAYNQLISKVDGMAAELASLKADSQK